MEFAQWAAEELAAPDASFDVVTCVYLFHELPEPVRRKAAQEMFRVLKPGGAWSVCAGAPPAPWADATSHVAGVTEWGGGRRSQYRAGKWEGCVASGQRTELDTG